MIMAKAGIMSGGWQHCCRKKFLPGSRINVDDILTDDDGPYLEIMVGAYSDNQPDYSWLHPFEERAFEVYFYPFREIDGVKNANLDAAVNLEVKDGKAELGFYSTKTHNNAVVTLKAGGRVLLEEQILINPANPYSKELTIPSGIDEHDIALQSQLTGVNL